jgi:hypothetical protein
MKILPCLVAGALLLTGSAWAQGNLSPAPTDNNAALRSELTVKQVVVLSNGTESLRAGAEVKPNDLLQYTVAYVNRSSSPVKRLVASLPIPIGTEWVDASAVPRQVMASTDGKVFLPTPLMRKVKHSDGHVSDEVIPLAEYRALRWPEQDLAAGATYTVSARVRVTALKAPDAQAANATPLIQPTTAR